ncbi:unnamed protein product [Cuscuta epithymum]|uniref:F-box domain-containing protein n=1 Tax=Cuscuta epithymum TaxID=186058 RepID=A0AAV0ENG4_9ASTE|nr:unnamed protein product [Cuscuta epithymum]
MASVCRRKTTSGVRNDYISQLPAELKESILELLSTREAAKMAMLSTHWKDVWYAHGHLVFDYDFFSYFPPVGFEDEPVDYMEIINRCLMLRMGSVKKFTLGLSEGEQQRLYVFIPLPLPAYINRWCTFLSRNGIEELRISVDNCSRTYKLQDCIITCPTIKQLLLGGFVFGFPANSHSVFPGVTSLVFEYIEFQPDLTGTVYNVPNLEKLSFENCAGIDNFVINAPKLKCLTTNYNYENLTDSRWFVLHFTVISTLHLQADLLWHMPDAVAAVTFPSATNLEVFVINNVDFIYTKHFTFVIELIQKCPKLCELRIETGNYYGQGDYEEEDASRILEYPNSFVIKKELQLLKTVKMSVFHGYRLEVLFVKTILFNSPALEELVITKAPHGQVALEIPVEILCSPRSSPKAQVLFLEYKY